MEALQRGAVTEVADSAEQAARRAALVVLAAPPQATLGLLDRLGAWLAPGAIATDVTSVKAGVMHRAVAAGLGDRFAGSHPLTGTHRTGFAAAAPDRLAGAIVYVCPTPAPGGEAAARGVAGFWTEVMGAQVVTIDAERHDEQLAWTSHLPQAAASALALVLAERGLAGVSYGPGGRDTTRLAGSDPDLWVEIFLQNAGPVAAALGRLEDGLARLRRAIEARDAALVHDLLARAAAFRRGLDP